MALSLSFKSIVCAIILFWLTESALVAQSMPVPIRVQYPLFLKMITYNRNLKAGTSDTIVLGVLYQQNFRSSLNVKEEFLTLMTEFPVKSVDGAPIRGIPINLSAEVDLGGELLKYKINVLYVTPLRAAGIESISAITRAAKVLTVTGVTEYVESGLSAGVGVKGEKPLLIINLPACKAEGADFDSRLLELARVIR